MASRKHKQVRLSLASAATPLPWKILVLSEVHVVAARMAAETLATQLDFSGPRWQRIVTTVAELARNIVRYAGEGVIIIQPVEREGRRGIEVIAADCDPGAVKDAHPSSGHTTSRRFWPARPSPPPAGSPSARERR